MSISTPLRRTALSTRATTYLCNQCRHATLIRRPKRPYTFTQLVVLSDGSTFFQRTTSPAAVYKCTRDQYNAPLWNPSSQKFSNLEDDEAGRLRAFRNKFGRGWDASAATEADQSLTGTEETSAAADDDNLLDLISGFGQNPEHERTAQGGLLVKQFKVPKGSKKSGKKK